MSYHSAHMQPPGVTLLNTVKLGGAETEHQVIVLAITQVIEKPNIPVIYYFEVADVSGQIKLCIYGSDGLHINEGDILLLRGCFVKQFADYIYLNMSRSGKVIRTGSFTLLFSNKPDLSHEFEIPEDYQPPRKQLNGNKSHSGAPTSRPSYSSYSRGSSNSSKYYPHQRSSRERL